MRILLLSHGHPSKQPGGTEQAAYALHCALLKDASIAASYLVIGETSDSAEAKRDEASFEKIGPKQYRALMPPLIKFAFQTASPQRLENFVDEIVARFKPDVVHVHHFISFGIEIFQLLKKRNIRVISTLHDFSFMCARFGQMVKIDGRLCEKAVPQDCSNCFPNVASEFFEMRHELIRRAFSAIDLFIAPSSFLRNRAIEWGIDPSRIVAIDNVIAPEVLKQASKVKHQASQQGRARIGYFGQMTPFKGVDILLRAFQLLSEFAKASLALRLHGDARNYENTSFGGELIALIKECQPEVEIITRYKNSDVLQLMRDCDWIVIPSIWWENSPTVLQEARLAGKPVICTDIGGLSEKSDRSTDILFPVGDVQGLKRVLEEIAAGSIVPATKQLAHHSGKRIIASRSAYAAHVKHYCQ
jgi:glycosyltransferase involved in cell wall biosynthesis